MNVEFGQMGPFTEALADVVVDLETAGWTLLYAFRTVIGDLTEVTNIWEVPDASNAYDVIHVKTREADFAARVAVLSKYVEGETLQLVAKLPFSP